MSTCERRERVWRHRGEHYAACNIIYHDRFGGRSLMVRAGISSESHTDFHVIANGALTAVRYRDEILRQLSDLVLVQWALGSSWCRTMINLIRPGCVSRSWMRRH